MAPTCGECADCGRGVIQQRTWLGATPEERAAWASAGCRMLKGHDLCANCYQRAYRNHSAAAVAATPETTLAAACRRCGVPRVSGLCVDCTEVVADLNEAARWVA